MRIFRPHVPTPNFLFVLAEGRIDGYRTEARFARNGDVDAATSEHISPHGEEHIYLGEPESLSIVSDSTDDAPGGNGARSIIIEGVDGNYRDTDIELRMSGTTPVLTSQALLRVNNVRVDTCGSAGSNVGRITVVPQYFATTHAVIEPGSGESHSSHYTVPEGYTGYLVAGRADIGGDPMVPREGVVRLMSRAYNRAWRNRRSWSIRPGHPANLVSDLPLQFPARCDMHFDIAVDTDDTSCFLQYSLVLVSHEVV